MVCVGRTVLASHEQSREWHGLSTAWPCVLLHTAGGGHKASAEALKQAFEEKYGDKYKVRSSCRLASRVCQGAWSYGSLGLALGRGLCTQGRRAQCACPCTTHCPDGWLDALSVSTLYYTLYYTLYCTL